ncbi:MAG: hypothetical protein AAF654_09070 [Myxococcota bacterium]
MFENRIRLGVSIDELRRLVSPARAKNDEHQGRESFEETRRRLENATRSEPARRQNSRAKP